jgi:hypothetical protein
MLGPRPRYALITSWVSDDRLDCWLTRELVAGSDRAGQQNLAAARR